MMLAARASRCSPALVPVLALHRSYRSGSQKPKFTSEIAKARRMALEAPRAHALTTPVPEMWCWHDGRGASHAFASVLRAVRLTVEEVPGCSIHIGTDSKLLLGTASGARNAPATYVYVSALCVYEQGRGVSYWHSRHTCAIPNLDLSMRLWKEVDNSIAVANEVKAHFGGTTEQAITVHADSNTDELFKSSRYTPMLVGIIKAMGYDYRVKQPAGASWASWLADKHCKDLRL
ncbi:hypothetical protein T492DRAFT_938974 [Pavlovales sp. CCMP2436]|nr:hypothetical protein T492DRAFT_938974 [Pavlovales sp. CCMP2436]|mmetsp:Transcript_29616/g.74505  ORF Transcript_29616/g.74505 Transcript_29616/m.74505 type:complete len:233 (+) Transcript_29616:147-845(+)